MLLTETDLCTIVKRCINSLLNEGYLDNTYMSPNFIRWFAGSKMVDQNGRPLLLGHATRSFGFDKFNTPFIHLSSINDASFFSGGSRRMFKDRSTINKLSDDEVAELYNKYFTYNGDNQLIELTDDVFERIMASYENELHKLDSPEEINKLSKYGIDANKRKQDFIKCRDLFLEHYKRYKGQLYFVESLNGLPRLTYAGYNAQNDEDRGRKWIEKSYPTTAQVREWVLRDMFKEDGYVGNGGTYPLCARVLKPLHVYCNGGTWDHIYITKESCEAYDGIFDLWERDGLNRSRLQKNSWIALDNESIAYYAQELGYDGVIFHDIREGALGEARMKETYIVFSTKQLKSPFENNGDFGDVENMFK